MKKKLLQIICLALLVCMILPVAVACGDNTNTGEGDTNESENNGSSDVDASDGSSYDTDENGFIKDTIDRQLTDTEITVLMAEKYINDILPDREAIENNKIAENSYRRKLELEKRLGCKFKVTKGPQEWSGRNEYVTVVEQSGLNNEGVDILCSFSLVPTLMVSRGMLTNLNKLEYPQIDMPWWPETIKDWMHSDALYFVANNSSNSVIRAQEVVFANTQMIADNGLDPLEPIVLNGDWTIDLMLTYAKNVIPDANQGVYGLAVDDQGRMDQFLYGSGIKLTTISNEGEIELASFEPSNIDKVDDLIEKLGEIAKTNNFFIDINDSTKLLKNKKTMFVAGYMDMLITTDPNNESGYIPLPTPKFDAEDQENYVTTLHNSFDMWSIPNFCANKEDAALVIEAIASTDYRTIAPQFYDKMLKIRYASSQNGVEIFDLIRNSTNIGFSRVIAASVDVLETPFRNCFSVGGEQVYENNYTDKMTDSAYSTYKTKLDTLLFEFDLYKDQ